MPALAELAATMNKIVVPTDDDEEAEEETDGQGALSKEDEMNGTEGTQDYQQTNLRTSE